jgi:hypothetical protein
MMAENEANLSLLVQFGNARPYCLWQLCQHDACRVKTPL